MSSVDVMTEYSNQFSQSPVGSAMSFIIGVLVIVAMWRIFTKAGEAGWKSLIPFLNVYILYKICWKGWIGIIQLVLAIFGVCSLVVSFVSAVAYNGSFTYEGQAYTVSAVTDPSTLPALAAALGVSLVIALALMLVSWIIGIVQCVKLAHAFDQGTGFAIGLILLPTIFQLILGFGSSTYIGNPNNPRIGSHMA